MMMEDELEEEIENGVEDARKVEVMKERGRS